MFDSVIKQQKVALRQSTVRQRRDMGAIARERASSIICDQLIALFDQRQPDCIAAFAPMPEEVDIWPALHHYQQKNRTIGLPRVISLSNQQMSFHIFDSRQSLIQNDQGISEPADDSPIISSQLFDFLIIPAVSIDQKNKRLGYGGGFYDKFLSGLPWAFSCAPIFYCQQVAAVPYDSHDQSVSMTITEKS